MARSKDMARPSAQAVSKAASSSAERTAARFLS
jgi:hypothetical protein